jgi:fatty-acyl-CoA synthase
MLQRILELGDEAIGRRDLSKLKVIFVSGSALSTDLVKRSLNAFGPVLYNMYGSTEIAYAAIARPEDLAEEPASVGKVVRGVVVKIFGDDGQEITEPGATGRIFVGNSSQFEGYTGGETKEQLEGLMSSGDVGHFDQNGRLFIDGRDDEMIVSGGENVFPAEVEELLNGHGAIEEVAVIGVDDEKFGQRLKGFVVLREGQQLSEDEIKNHVKENLARYKVPREVVFLDELPRNSTGKVLKRELEKHGDADERRAGDEEERQAGGEEERQAGGEQSGQGTPSGGTSKARSNGATRRKPDDGAAKRSGFRSRSANAQSKTEAGAGSAGAPTEDG